MPNKEAKIRKSERIRKNDDLKKNGRTASQVKVRKMKEALKAYTKRTGYKFPSGPSVMKFQTYINYNTMRGMIDIENKRLRKEAEALKIKQEQEKEKEKNKNKDDEAPTWEELRALVEAPNTADAP